MQRWFHVKSEWQKNPEISTLCNQSLIILIISDFSGYHYAHDYYKKGGYLCPSDIYYGRPKRAMNTYGKWKVIVNLPDEYYAKGYGKGMEKYSQTQRLEQCM